MSSTKSLTVGFYLVTLLLGVGIGRWSTSGSGNGPASGGEEERGSRTSGGSAESGSKSSRRVFGATPDLERELESLPESITISPSVLESLARAKGVRAPRNAFFAPQDPLIAALEMDDSEVAGIQGSWRQSLEGIRREEVANSEVSEDDTAITLTVAPISEFRAGVREEFGGQLRTILGADRGAALFALKGGSELFRSSEDPRKYRVNAEDAGEGRWQFRIEETVGEGRKVWIADAIPPELRHLTDAASIAPRLSDPSGTDDCE